MKRKRHSDIDHSILSALKGRRSTISFVSTRAKVNWVTAKKHLSNLENLGIVEKRIDLANTKIYALTDIGERIVR